MSSLKKFRILKNDISFCDYRFILNKIITAKREKSSLLIAPVATHQLAYARLNTPFYKALKRYHYLLPDSQWIKWAIWFLYGKRLKDRISGTDLMLKICSQAGAGNLSVLLYGNTIPVLKCLKSVLIMHYPDIHITGLLPADFKKLDLDLDNLVKFQSSRRTDIIFISLGGIKQYNFAQKLYSMIPEIKRPSAIIPVGAAFDFISRNKPQAPLWMQKSGLEWFFRLSNEPVRLWKRYVIYGGYFLISTIIQKIKQIRK